MPFYCYTTKDGVTHERMYSMHGKIPERIRVGGKVAVRDINAEHNGLRMRVEAISAKHPWQSDALGVHPDQIPEATAELRRQGVRESEARFMPDGRLECYSTAGRRKACYACGMYDRNGGYSDPQKRGVIPKPEPVEIEV